MFKRVIYLLLLYCVTESSCQSAGDFEALLPGMEFLGESTQRTGDDDDLLYLACAGLKIPGSRNIYFVSKYPATYDTALKICQDSMGPGALLLSIDSETELELVSKFLANLTDFTAGSSYWINEKSKSSSPVLKEDSTINDLMPYLYYNGSLQLMRKIRTDTHKFICEKEVKQNVTYLGKMMDSRLDEELCLILLGLQEDYLSSWTRCGTLGSTCEIPYASQGVVATVTAALVKVDVDLPVSAWVGGSCSRNSNGVCVCEPSAGQTFEPDICADATVNPEGLRIFGTWDSTFAGYNADQAVVARSGLCGCTRYDGDGGD